MRKIGKWGEEEDEEGRFFGGGLSKEQKEILNIFDKDVTEGVHEDVSDAELTELYIFDNMLARRDESSRRASAIATV